MLGPDSAQLRNGNTDNTTKSDPLFHRDVLAQCCVYPWKAVMPGRGACATRSLIRDTNNSRWTIALQLSIEVKVSSEVLFSLCLLLWRHLVYTCHLSHPLTPAGDLEPLSTPSNAAKRTRVYQNDGLGTASCPEVRICGRHHLVFFTSQFHRSFLNPPSIDPADVYSRS